MTLRPAKLLYQYRGHKQTTAPSVEPVTAAELRTHLRETATGLPDTEAEGYIAEAREYIEEQTGIALITQTWLMALDRWPSGQEPWWSGTRQGAISELAGPSREVRLPRYPLQSIDSVTVYDEASNATVVSVAATFDVDTYQTPGRLTLKSSATWPVALRDTNGVEVSYISGYGDAATDVPAAIRGAVRRMAGYHYANRGDGCGVGNAYTMSGAETAMRAYMVARI